METNRKTGREVDRWTHRQILTIQSSQASCDHSLDEDPEVFPGQLSVTSDHFDP